MSSGSQEDVLLVVHSTAAQPHADRLHLVEENGCNPDPFFLPCLCPRVFSTATPAVRTCTV
eukprot:1389121-Rhodomonas_salina.1